jgi:hypothetical protein
MILPTSGETGDRAREIQVGRATRVQVVLDENRQAWQFGDRDAVLSSTMEGAKTMAVATSQAGGRFDIGRVFSNTFSVMGRNIGLWLGLALIFSAIPTLVLQYVILSPLTGGGDLTDPNLSADPSFLWKYYVGTFAGILISLVLSSLLSSSLIRATIEDMSGRTPSIGDCIKTALAVLLPTIGVGLVVGIAVMIGLALLIVPGIILWLRWSVSVPVLVQERQGVFGSMGRSAALTSGSRWSLFGLFLILVIVSIAIEWLVGMVVPALGTWLSLITEALVQSVLSMVISTATAVSYAELRQVKEGTSVNELAEIFA